jgi:multiple sugar transport system substrate-binding protein
MKLTKRALSVGAIVALALPLTVSTRSPLSAGRATAAPAHATVTISLASWSTGAVEGKALAKLLADFEAKNPSIKVNYQIINGDYPTVMKARITAGTAPDVFYMNSDVAQEFIRGGQLLPLDFLAQDKSFGLNQFYKSLLNGYSWNGHLYGIPKDYSTLALWYNPTMFAAHGIAKAPTTWSEFASDACKLTDKSKKIYGASLSADPARWLAVAYAYNATLFNKDLSKATISSPAAAQSLDLYAGLVKKGCAARPDQVGAGWNGESYGKQFAAMTVEGNWMTPFMHDQYPKTAYKIAPLPSGPQGIGNIEFTVSYSISAHTQHQAQATTLLKFLTGQAGMTDWVKINSYIPSRQDVKPLSYMQPFLKQVPSSKEWFFPPGVTSIITGPASDDIRKVMEGSMTGTQAVNDMQTRINKALTSAP